MISYWEKESFLNFHFIVVGGGIVGLSTAIHYKNKYPSHQVAILERGLFPSGASTKNAGFACFGSLTELIDDLSVMTEDEIIDLVSKRYHGIQKVRKAFGDDAIGYKHSFGYELISGKDKESLSKLDDINELLKPIFNDNVFSVVREEHKFSISEEVECVVKNAFEGELDSGKFLSALWKKCQDLNIRIFTGALVSKVDLKNKKVTVENSLLGEVNFSSEKIAICTNAFTKQLMPELDLSPGRGLVMLLKLSKKNYWEGTFHFDRGYVYFRNINGKILIGGGRNIDKETETTLAFGVNPIIQEYLFNFLKDKLLISENDYEVEMEWSGIMAFGGSKNPIIVSPEPGVGIAVRLGGMGVAIGYEVAEEMVSLL